MDLGTVAKNIHGAGVLSVFSVFSVFSVLSVLSVLSVPKEEKNLHNAKPRTCGETNERTKGRIIFQVSGERERERNKDNIQGKDREGEGKIIFQATRGEI